MISKEKEYRLCVGIMLFNKHGDVFVGKRFDSDSYWWQMPQGGIDGGEELEKAALRELLEEVGTYKVKIMSQNKEWIYYDIPKEVIPTYWNGRFSGQKQMWFLMKFCGKDKDININYTDNPEFKEWRWQNIANLVATTIPFKKTVYKKVIEEFSCIIKGSIYDS